MDTNKMREQFEARYPVPEGCCWHVEQRRYVLFNLKLCTVAMYERFVESWVCWQASREAVLVELQAEIDSYVRERREAIEAKILEVAP